MEPNSCFSDLPDSLNPVPFREISSSFQFHLPDYQTEAMQAIHAILQILHSYYHIKIRYKELALSSARKD